MDKSELESVCRALIFANLNLMGSVLAILDALETMAPQILEAYKVREGEPGEVLGDSIKTLSRVLDQASAESGGPTEAIEYCSQLLERVAKENFQLVTSH